MLSDVLPTAFECGVLNGKAETPGISIAIVGAGPIGLATLLTARFFSPGQIIMIDRDENRLATAKKLGTDVVINNTTHDPTAQIKELTGGVGVDVVIAPTGSRLLADSSSL